MMIKNYMFKGYIYNFQIKLPNISFVFLVFLKYHLYLKLLKKLVLNKSFFFEFIFHSAYVIQY